MTALAESPVAQYAAGAYREPRNPGAGPAAVPGKHHYRVNTRPNYLRGSAGALQAVRRRVSQPVRAPILARCRGGGWIFVWSQDPPGGHEVDTTAITESDLIRERARPRSATRG
jgi:hypothetical protein